MHQYFNIEGVTDLAVMREQANARTKPNNKWGLPEESVIHFHKHDMACSPIEQHEFYAVQPLTTVDVQKAFWRNHPAAATVKEVEH